MVERTARNRDTSEESAIHGDVQRYFDGESEQRMESRGMQDLVICCKTVMESRCIYIVATPTGVPKSFDEY